MLSITGVFSCSNSNEDDSISDEKDSLTEVEKNDLLVLREEEKLARDVYLYAFEKYGLNIFTNISSSEETHMNRVLSIMNVYDLSDNADVDRGVFNNVDLQVLYVQLIEKVDLSISDALIVGVTIEDLDIKDIEDFKKRTQKTDILEMYTNLACGSRNHLRSYYSLLRSYGGSYSSQYISQQYFDDIINSSSETCGR